jgi:UrcA family protein
VFHIAVVINASPRRIRMSIHDSIPGAAGSRSAISLIMALCGAVGVAAAGAASAAAQQDDVPRIVVRYSAETLATDSGARKLYEQLVHAAAEVCPADSSSRLVSPVTLQCREQSIARAVHDIGNPRLAAVYATSSKNG